MIRHPAFYALSCGDCEKWLHVDGIVTRRVGLPVARPKGVITPCHTCPKTADAPVRDRRHATEPTDRSRRVLRHYRECRAVGRFPDDPIVRRNAGLIREVEDALAAARLDALADLGAVLLKRLEG